MGVITAARATGDKVAAAMISPRTVFLSSTSLDLQLYRDAIASRLAGSRFFRCERYEQSGPADMSAPEFCKAAVEASDIYVGVIGMRRGFEPDGLRSITEMEFDWAGKRGIPRMVWLSPPGFPFDGAHGESAASEQRQRFFRERVRRSVIVGMSGFDTPAQLALEVENHLLAYFVASQLAGLNPVGGSNFVQKQLTKVIEESAGQDGLDLNELASNPEELDAGALFQRLDRRVGLLGKKLQEQPGRAPEIRSEIAKCLREMAALASVDFPDYALELYEKALKYGPDHIPTRIGYGDWLERTGRPDEAEKQYRLAEKQAHESGDKGLEAEARHSHALLLAGQGKLSLAVRRLEELIPFYQSENNLGALASVYCALGGQLKIQGDLDAASGWLEKARLLGEAVKREDILSDIYSELASVSGQLGNMVRRKEYLLKALELALNKDLAWQTIAAYLGLAGHALNEGNLQDSLEYADKGLRLAECFKLPFDIPYFLEIKANIAYRKGDAKEAISYAEEAVAKLKALKKPYAALGMTAELASVYIDLGELDLAEARLKGALREAEVVEIQTPKISIFRYLGDIEARRRNRRRARRYYQEGLRLAKKLKFPAYVKELQAALSANGRLGWLDFI